MATKAVAKKPAAKKPADVTAWQACASIRQSCARLGLPDDTAVSLKQLVTFVDRVMATVSEAGFVSPVLFRDLDQG